MKHQPHRHPPILSKFLVAIITFSSFAFPNLIFGAGQDINVGVTVCDGGGNCQTPIPTPPPTLPPTPPPAGASAPPTSSQESGSPPCEQPAPDSAPYLISATRLSEDSIRLNFTPAGKPLTHYALFYGFDPNNFVHGATFSGPDDLSSFIVDDLLPGQTYYFQLVGVNDCAGGPASNIFPVTLATNSIFPPLLLPPPKSPPLAIGESTQAPTQVYPLEEVGDSSSENTGITATHPEEPVITAVTPETSVQPSLLGLFFTAGCACYFSGSFWWWWLCWPWWFIFLMIFFCLYCYYLYRKREQKKKPSPKT